MTTETHTVAMTDPQLNNNNNNNNNDGEPKYLHKKFKKMATTEASAPVQSKREIPSEGPISPEGNRREKDGAEDSVKEPTAAKIEPSPEPEGETNEGRKGGNVCPYCKLSCAKPSVLQKHIRAHTNERPYPCVPCGFAFKTRSNLYKHCRSRAHALKMEGGDSSKVSEDSDISLSDSASNGTGTPPPPASSVASGASASLKTVKTGKIYKPKFHTALNSVSQEAEASSVSSNSSTNSVSGVKPNAEQLQEHIDKIITDNQAIVGSVDPRLHKFMQRQQSLVEPKYTEQPLNLSSAEESSQRKRCYSESFAQDKGEQHSQQNEGATIKDLLLKNRGMQNCDLVNGDFSCPSCKISYTSADNLDAHRRYYCGGAPSPRRPEFQLDLEKREPEMDLKSDYYNALQPLPSPGPLLGNTRLVDAYVPPGKQRSESAPTTLRSLEELSKYPRPNSLQMFGGEVRILDNTGETKTMRIEPRQTNSPSDHNVNSKCATSETSSIVVRSGLHSGGTMVHKPPGTPASTPSGSISLPNTPKMLAPIIPNISTPNIAPTISCYSYLEPNLNPLNNITAYNPLTLPQAGIASILHAGKVIPYVPGMPGPHTLSAVSGVDISVSIPSGDAGYKVIPGIPGLHVVPQPLDLASPVKMQTPNVPGIPGPHSNLQMPSAQPLDLASPAKEFKLCFKTPNSDNLRAGLVSPKLPNLKVEGGTDKFRPRAHSGTPNSESIRAEQDCRIMKGGNPALKYKNSPDCSREKRKFAYDKSPKSEKAFVYPNGTDNGANSPYGKLRYSPKHVAECRKRPGDWRAEYDANIPSVEPLRQSPVLKYEPLPTENGRTKVVLQNLSEGRSKTTENYAPINGAKIKPDSVAPIITVNLDSSSTEVPNKVSAQCKFDDSRNDKPDKNLVDDCADDFCEESNTKFLRPTSLPLKPGTFTPKRHHGITPTANTLPLISPETPRPRKSYGQLYLNGHAYTYLGLKCSTRVFYCTLNRPQPMYVTQQHGLSMYSNWKICKEAPPDLDMAHYDSRHRPMSYTTACKKQEDILTHSSQRPTTPASTDNSSENDTQEKAKRVKIFDGGFESNEDYIYVRGRGRGRYVCEECGIRCKKPSMLKKHIRTHTDVRPYTCKHCTFSFKTKGNLTKHMKSKAHYKKCVELGVVPVPTLVCDENIDKEAVARLVAGGGNAEESSEEEDESDGDESEESGSEEHEAAQGLLSLSQRSTNRLPGLLPSGRPTTYPYTLTLSPSTVCTSVTTTTSSSAPLSSQAAAVIQSELSHRYYFPSNRSVQEKTPRTSVIIQSSKKSDSEIELDEAGAGENQSHSSQPMDLTTKQTIASLVSPVAQRTKPADILTPVSEPVFMQTIVQSMERLPAQGREWKSEAQGQMLQAYLTERHVMDSKMKLQYRVGCVKMDKNCSEKEIQYLKQQDVIRSRNLELNGVPTVTYTDPSKMQQTILESKIKSLSKHGQDEAPIDVRDKIYLGGERRPFDIDSVYKEKENAGLETSVSIISKGVSIERPHFGLELPGRSTPSLESQSPRHFNIDMMNRNSSALCHQIKNEIDRSSMFNAMKMMSEVERPRESVTPNHETRPPSRETRAQSQSPRSQDLRPPSREIRGQNQDSRIAASGQEFRLPGQEFKPVNQESRTQSQEIPPSNSEPRPPSRETRPLESRANFELKSSPIRDIPPSRPPSHEPNKSQGIVEVRRDSERAEMKQNIDAAKQQSIESIKHSVARKMVVGGPGFRSPSPPGGSGKPQAEFLQPSTGPAPNYVSYSVTEDGRSVCGICNKVFSKPSQLRLHINIHYFERPFRCESCAVSFRTKGHLTKHERSVSHHNKVSMTSTFGAATTSNPRPFKCTDCKIAFRIHGHLAKHLRSKMHIMKLECLGKLPFGTYAEMERSGINLNDIDTSDCDNSLTSLQNLAQKLYEKDPSKMGQWDAEMIPNHGASGGETSSDEGEPIPLHSMHQYPPQLSISDVEGPRGYHMPILVSEESKPVGEIRHANPQFNHQRHAEFSAGDRQHRPPRIPLTNIADEPNHGIEEGAQMFKCNICSVSIRSLKELQVHCFVDHNVESDSNSASIGRGDRSGSERKDGDNRQKRNCEENVGSREEVKRQKLVDDT